jgi:hypothetical protein
MDWRLDVDAESGLGGEACCAHPELQPGRLQKAAQASNIIIPSSAISPFIPAFRAIYCIPTPAGHRSIAEEALSPTCPLR